MSESRIREPLAGRFVPHAGPYAGTDFGIARTFSGAAMLAGSALVTALLPFYPPTHEIGSIGWAVVGILLAATVVTGVGILTRRIRLTGARLLVSAYAGIAMLTVLAWLAGGPPAPYPLLCAATLVPAAMIQPFGRLAPLALFYVVVSVLPLVTGRLPQEQGGELAIQLVLTLSLGAAVALVMAEVRRHRLQARAETTRANSLARIDGLTGLGNRRAFEETARRELLRAERQAKPLTLVMLDLDGFKAVNDDFGHLGGDRFLCAVADALTHCSRPSDSVFRWAGDEFAVLLPDADEGAAAGIVARWPTIVRDVTRATGRELEFSAGTVTARAGAELDALVSAADDAMYRQKPSSSDYAAAGLP